MIKIVYDPTNLISQSNNKINHISEYAQAVEGCLTQFNVGNEVDITISQPAMLQWFKNMSARYPQGFFKFETIDPRSVLAQRWEMEIPNSVSNEDIQQSGLLSLVLQPQPGFDFEDTILTHFFAPIFSAKSFPFDRLSTLVLSVEPARWKDNQKYPLVMRLLKNRQQSWKAQLHTSEQRQLVDLFFDDPFDLARRLKQYRVLSFYPTLGRLILGDHFDLFYVLKLPLETLPVEEESLVEVLTQVTYHLNTLQVTNADDLLEIIPGLSGLLNLEFDWVEKLLLGHPLWINQEMINHLTEKFGYGQRYILARIQYLQHLVRPPYPSQPEMDWEVQSMLTWAVEEYLPYQAWCNAQTQFDPALYQLGDQFSSWLMEHWFDVRANSNKMVFNIFPHISQALQESGKINLVLVIDNLGWQFADKLSEIFLRHKFYLGESQPYLAMLPTETEISKKCLLSGTVGYQEIDDKSYGGMIEKGWLPYFQNANFKYLSDVGSLNQIESIDASTYVINYLAVDKALHQSEKEIGQPHLKQIPSLLSFLVETVVAFINRHNLTERVRIHVVSDHGSTRIPKSMPNDINPDFFKGSGFDARSHRYLKVSPKTFAGLADNHKMDSFFLNKADFLLPYDCLVARRANRYSATDLDHYVHGGLLPEEVIVPYLLFEPASQPLKSMDISLVDNQFRYRKEEIRVDIGNPNYTAIEQVQIEVLNHNVESEPAFVRTINGKHKVSLTIPARFKLTNQQEEQKQLRFSIRYFCRGESHSETFSTQINMLKMVEVKHTDLFDDLE